MLKDLMKHLEKEMQLPYLMEDKFREVEQKSIKMVLLPVQAHVLLHQSLAHQ